MTLEVGIPEFTRINVSTGVKFKKLLAIIAESVPFKPNLSKLAELLSVSRNNTSDYLLCLEQAGMISQLRKEAGGVHGLGKVRETFFFNQMRLRNEVVLSPLSDFLIGNVTFEVGGKNKGKKQTEKAYKGYVVKDGIEFGFDNVIPLWHFGFNY